MQRIFSIYDWQRLPVGSKATITSELEDQRPVRLKVNAPAPMSLFILQDDIEEEIFLAHIVGLDEIEFHVVGNYTLLPLGGDVWFDTLDGSNPAVEPVEPASFTQIVERRVRNPEMELMERKMQENIDRRMAAMYANVTHTIAMKDAEIAAARTIAPKIDTIEPAQANGQTPPVEPAAPVGTGESAGGVPAVE